MTDATETAVTFTPIQALRHEARGYGRAARDALTGITGLTTDEQIERLGVAYGAYAKAQEVVTKALEVVGARGDGVEYQKTKHQGLDGWAVHVTTVHGVPLVEVGTLEDAAGVETADEAAYFLHQGFGQHTHDGA